MSQISADGEAMIFHDDELDRLTEAHGAVKEMKAADLKRVVFKRTADRMVTLAEYTEQIAGRVPLIIEIKSRFDGEPPAGRSCRGDVDDHIPDPQR